MYHDPHTGTSDPDSHGHFSLDRDRNILHPDLYTHFGPTQRETLWTRIFTDNLDPKLLKQFGTWHSQTISDPDPQRHLNPDPKRHWSMTLTQTLYIWTSQTIWTLILTDTLNIAKIHFELWPFLTLDHDTHRHFELWPSQTLWTPHTHIHTLDHDPKHTLSTHTFTDTWNSKLIQTRVRIKYKNCAIYSLV